MKNKWEMINYTNEHVLWKFSNISIYKTFHWSNLIHPLLMIYTTNVHMLPLYLLWYKFPFSFWDSLRLFSLSSRRGGQQFSMHTYIHTRTHTCIWYVQMIWSMEWVRWGCIIHLWHTYTHVHTCEKSTTFVCTCMYDI